MKYSSNFFITVHLLTTFSIFMSACNTSKSSDDPVLTYHCTDGSEAKISFSEELAHLAGTLNGKTYDLDLPHVESASGARYSNDSVTVWGKGKDMMIEAGGITYNCTEVKAN